MNPVRLHVDAEAEGDVNDATTFYRRISPAVASAFLADLRAALALVREHPRSGVPHRHGTRRRRFGHFPYSLIYLVDGDSVTVVAVMHDRRDPEHWRTRLYER